MATILIVDDLPADRKLLVAILESQGHRMIEAASGRDGLVTARDQHPDLVITDVLMPVMDGYEFARKLGLDPSTKAIPVLFYTASYAAREARTHSRASGVSSIVTKPAVTADVIQVVEEVLARGAAPMLLPETLSSPTEIDREHLRILADTLSSKSEDLRRANARLRALINIGLELASERDPELLLQHVCVAARDLFGATYVTLGIVDLKERTIQRFVTCGAENDCIKTGDLVGGVFETVVTERRTVRGDLSTQKPLVPLFPPRHPEVQTFLAAPIASPAQVYGWFCLVGNEGRAFTEEEQDLITALSGQIGRIYENSHFHLLAQKRAEALEHEVMEREQAESALRKERDRAQRYLDTAAVFLVALDVEGRITLVNRYACSVLGWTADELIGESWLEKCVPPRLRRELDQKLENLLGGDVSMIENPVLTRSGGERLIEWRNTLLRDESGQVTGTFSSGTDTTDKNEALEALRATEERTRFALQGANVGIWDMDYATGTNRWSETLEAHYGLEPGGFDGTFEGFVAHVHPDDRRALLETIGDAMKTGSEFTVQNRTIWPDGSVRWLNGIGRVLLGENGEPERAVGISVDVTDRMALEAQTQQAQKMEAVGRLAGGVAHDFNNLLTAILGYCEMLLADLDRNDPHRTDVSKIQKAGVSAAALTRQLLAFSRKEIIEPKLFDLNVVVSDLRVILGRLIREDVKVVLGLRSGLVPVLADRGQVEQIVLNLALNARDAMPRGGTLTIETANAELDEAYARTHVGVIAGTHVMLTVTDTGTGMTPEIQARMFEPFFTTKELGKGTGFGLATVHGIVARAGGSVAVDSVLGKGTTFRVYFPMADTGELSPEPPPMVPRPGAKTQTVLVVEDAEGVRDLASRLLERQGYHVLVAASSDEAFGLFERNPSIDVLLTDVVMPGGSGPELTSRLQSLRPGLKVVYMSGYTEDAIVDHGVLNPEIVFLHKPFTSDELGRKILEAIDR